MHENRVRRMVSSGALALGAYVTTGSPEVIEWLARAGLAFVRIDLESNHLNPETSVELVRAAHAVGVTPFVRVPEWMGFEEMYKILSAGARGVIVPRVADRRAVESIVDAIKAPPLGSRIVRPDGVRMGPGFSTFGEAAKWWNENVLVCVQIETRTAVECVEEIASVAGVDMLVSGRNDLATSYGLPGEQFAPIVQAAEGRTIRAAWDAGKIPSVTYFPLRGPEQVEALKGRIKEGVKCVALGMDSDLSFALRLAVEMLTATGGEKEMSR